MQVPTFPFSAFVLTSETLLRLWEFITSISPPTTTTHTHTHNINIFQAKWFREESRVLLTMKISSTVATKLVNYKLINTCGEKELALLLFFK